MELRPHSIKILTHECHAFLATLAENRAQGQFHLHFPDDKTLTFVAGTLKVRHRLQTFHIRKYFITIPEVHTTGRYIV
jgi:hypothetical protein